LRDFKLQTFLDCAAELLRADETTRALWLLNNLPAYYRDHVPQEIIDMKNEIHKRISTPSRYGESKYEIDVLDLVNANGMGDTLRGQILQKDIKWLNQQKFIPHIVDFGPGEFWLPIALKAQNLQFTYDPIALNQTLLKIVEPHIEKHLVPRLPNQPTVYVACEIIEHLWNEQDLKTEMLRKIGFADIVHISTPRYTYDTDCMSWLEKGEIGHLRAYTPLEFVTIVKDLFPEYLSFFIDSQIMHLRLTHQRTTIQGLRERAANDFDKL